MNQNNNKKCKIQDIQ